MFPDLISLAIGASIGAGIASVIWLVFLLWMLTKSYTMGWNDAQKGKWIGDEEEVEECQCQHSVESAEQ